MEWIKSRFRTDDVVNTSATPLYSFSSWMYSIVGLYFLYTYSYNSLYEGHFTDSLLLITQGYLSYLGDVKYLSTPHYSKVIDKIFAICFTIRFIKMNFLQQGVLLDMVFFITLPTGMYCYYHSNKANVSRNYKDYIYWHTLWHFTYPSGIFVWINLKGLEYKNSKI